MLLFLCLLFPLFSTNPCLALDIGGKIIKNPVVRQMNISDAKLEIE